ncbi:MAG: glycoside hydrolase family 3 C-terminal domain-containing protein, partial [Clostridia bacterium]|nr:glycoside hydrolase family 3 C-terminal domain-containing protein [Clostridia bacterium]
DWGATHDRAAVVSAGCDLTMPAPGTDGAVVDAVKNEFLDERDLDACCERVLELVFKAVEQRATRSKAALDLESGHQFVAAAAADGMVLLKNDDDLLPLKSTESLAFIGRFAAAPRFQGGGSANIHAFKPTSALDAAKAAGLAVSYVDGYEADGSTNADLLAEAVAAAKAADVAVVFAGLHDEMEVEGYDRAHMRMSDGHNSLIEAVCAANPNTVVVLHNGSPIEMPWVKLPKAILETYLGGQAVGEATINVLTGVVNPSGHLAETFPKACSDNPSYLFFGGEDGVVPYPEGVFIGYRYYTSKSIETLFPFGHGLSYTTFAYRDLRLDATCAGNTDTVTATVTVQNTGDRAGKALVQLYVAPPKSRKVIRPVRELKAFEKIELQPGESRTVTLSLPSRAFAHWNTAAHDWRIEPGEYGIQICENATSVLLQETVVIA